MAKLRNALPRLLRELRRHGPRPLVRPIDRIVTKRRIDSGWEIPPGTQLDAFAQALQRLAEYGPPGDYIEFGVYFGSSLARMHEAQRRTGIRTRIFGFDSFDGMPNEGPPLHHRGEFFTTEDLTWYFLNKKGIGKDDGVTLVPGPFEKTCVPETASRLGVTKAGIVMLDADLYDSTAAALRFVRPLLDNHCVIMLDEYDDASAHQEERAFNEFLVTGEFEIVEELLPRYLPKARVFLLARC